MLQAEKEIVLLLSSEGVTSELLQDARRAGVQRLLTKDALPRPMPQDGFSLLRVADTVGEGTVTWVTISGPEDVERAIEASALNQEFVVVECTDWTVIPLENLVAEYRRRGRRLYAFASSLSEIETALLVLERGVDGVVVPPTSLSALGKLSINREQNFSMVPAMVTRILDAGLGDRACVDTTSNLREGEGLLVGSKAGFFFLIHGETLRSEYIPPRPFRVNAGAVHAYVLSSDGKTRYLSELEPPDRVTVFDRQGSGRSVSVGRVKIERRPLVLVEANVGGESGSVILQKAETIRLLRSDGTPVSVTDLRPNDEVLVHTEPTKARHFGGDVDEFILEK